MVLIAIAVFVPEDFLPPRPEAPAPLIHDKLILHCHRIAGKTGKNPPLECLLTHHFFEENRIHDALVIKGIEGIRIAGYLPYG